MIQTIVNKILIILLQVDMRYSTIRESDFSINIRLVGIYIAAVRISSVSVFSDNLMV